MWWWLGQQSSSHFEQFVIDVQINLAEAVGFFAFALLMIQIVHSIYKSSIYMLAMFLIPSYTIAKGDKSPTNFWDL